MKRLIERYKKARDVAQYWRDKGARIGQGCEIYASAALGSEPYLIDIGNNVRISAGASLITHDGGVWVLRRYLKDDGIDLFGPIRIGNNVHIGAGATILPGVTIGNNCIVGCGAIVTKDIPDNSIAVGVPARIIESVEEYAKKHQEDFDHTKRMPSKEKRAYLLNKFYGVKE